MARIGILFLWLVGSACTKPNPDYCDDSRPCADGMVCNLNSHTCGAQSEDGGLDSGSTTCASNDECLDPAAPICSATQTCRACALDDECTSRVCRDDGSCEAVENILYVSTDGIAAGQCPSTAPCELSYALGAVTATRYSLRVNNGAYALTGSLMPTVSKLVIVGGRSAVFSRTSTGLSFVAQNGTQLTLRGITLTRGVACTPLSKMFVQSVAFNSPGSEVRPWIASQQCDITLKGSELTASMTHAVDVDNTNLTVSDTLITNNQGTGIRLNSGHLLVERTEISTNQGIGIDATASSASTIVRSRLYDNRMGGVQLLGTQDYTLLNNFIYHNGNDSNAPFGGVRLDTSGTHRLEHNSIIYNERAYSTASPIYAGGIYCTGTGSNANNLIVYNFHGNTSLPAANTNGSCDFSSSVVSEMMTPFNFVRPAALPFDYHLADSQSAAANVGTGGLSVSDDFDGEARADGLPDVGADEFVP